jgi:peptidoglycan lytic transglycosylase G
MSERTPEEREAARRERERRRALREGRPVPPEPAPAPQPLKAASVAAGHHDPPATQQFDVTDAWAQEAAAPPAAPEPPAQEPALEDAWTDEHEVPLGIRRVSAHERLTQKRPHLHRPHLPHRRGARPTGEPREPRRGGRIAAAIVLVLVVALGWFLISLFQPFTGDGSGRVVVQVPAGASASQIGDLLAKRGVVSSSFFFRLRATLDGVRGDLRSGTFTLRHGMSYGAALDTLTHVPPPPPIVKVTIPEGRSRREAAALVAQDGLRGSYLAATRRSSLLDPHRYGARRGATLEGFLFPATYDLRPHASVEVLVAKQLAAFKDALAQVDLRAARRKNLTPFDVVTIASMVEREVAVAKERPLVAAVIYNRLRLGMPLGIDATLRFALNDWTSPLTESQLRNRTPYNLRLHQGLPPGPIGNPGLASLQAAAHPAHVKYLFYVVKPGTCGEHAFSSTDAQFQRDVARYNAARAAAGGKSPTKC